MKNYEEPKPGKPTYPARHICVIDAKTCDPQNEDTSRIQKLIGTPLTRFEMASQKVTLEFGDFGCIIVEMRSLIEVGCIIAPRSYYLRKLEG
jgi:hypothetical protein